MAAVSRFGRALCYLYTLQVSLFYCGLNEIQQIFSNIPQLLAISCSEHINTEVMFILISAVLDV